MIRTRSGLPKHCSWNTDRHGRRRVRFRKGAFSTYLTGIPWSEDFMRQYAAALDQGKTEGGEQAHLEIPVHPKLREIIDSTPTLGVKTFLVTNFGKPFTPSGFGNWFRDRCNEAGCPDISAHGGRKATARRLAEI